jgi:hypothetical protein
MARHVLLIEPDVDRLGQLAEQLRARGLSVSLASDFQSLAIRSRSTSRPHLVFISAQLVDETEDENPFRLVPELSRLPRVFLVEHGGTEGLQEDEATYSDIDRLVARALEVKPASSPPADSSSGNELRGNLQQLPLVDVLQMLSLHRRTGVLMVSTPAGAGELRIVDGEVLDAVYRRLEGEKAIYRLVSQRDGTFSFIPGHASAIARVVKGTSALLMEAMRQQDEFGRLYEELAAKGPSFVAVDKELDPEAPAVWEEVLRTLESPRRLEELVDELPMPDLEIMQALVDLLDAGLARALGELENPSQLCPPSLLPMVRALVTRLQRQGFQGPPRLGIISSPTRIHTFGHALLRVSGSSPPAEPFPAVPVPHELGTLRLGENASLLLIGMPVVEAFLPLWTLTLPSLGAIVSLENPASTLTSAICDALEARYVMADQLVANFDEANPSHVAEMIRKVVEQVGAG